MRDAADGATGASLDWAVAVRAVPGESVCGDVAVGVERAGRHVLAVVDGLGHGPEAAHAARLAVGVVEDHPEGTPAVLLAQMHRRLADSRGAAATVLVVDVGTGLLDWLGVGNVDAVVVRADGAARPPVHGVFMAGGVLGAQMPVLPETRPVRLAHGDSIVVATDGVRADLAEAARSPLRPDVLARRLLDEHALPRDDALVLAARYLAARPARVAW
ncbi:MAG TPA: SpoIIE family protein phosphatase [Acidimicrobiales bacterium]|nr:SpoIIE family protein phosphatase [Acidimicrobiales bacterium]